MIFARFLLAVALSAALPLAGCGKKPQQETRASGQILDGSISDDMIHLDQLKSEAPVAAPKGDGAETTKSGTAPARQRGTGARKTASPAAELPRLDAPGPETVAPTTSPT
jgi:hypothetical protein